MKVFVDESPAGVGKTHRAIADIVARPCRVIFVTERILQFDELRGRINAAAMLVGTRPVVREINSKHTENGVRMAIEAIPADNAVYPHVIVMVTHAGFLSANFEAFTGWRLVIDEVPNFLASQSLATSLDFEYFDQFYTLEPVNDDHLWSIVGLTDAGRRLTSAHVQDDDSHKHLRNFHDRVLASAEPESRRHVICNLRDWSEMKDRAVHWLWGSVFSMTQLAAFERVELLGNRYLQDVACRMVQFVDGDEVEWVRLPSLANSRFFAHRTVRVHHFTKRPSSRSFLVSDVGQRVLTEIGTILANRLPTGRSIWSTNEDFAETLDHHLPAADFITPRQAGTNAYASIHDAAIIYSAKPSSMMTSLLEAMDQSKQEWVKSVEYETILQFVTRTSIRDANSTAPVSVYVFDEGQADYLVEYLSSLSHVTVEREYIPLPFEFTDEVAKGGRPKSNLSPEEAAQRKIEEREKARLRQQLARQRKREELA